MRLWPVRSWAMRGWPISSQLARERKISPWTGLGTLYGSRDAVAGAVRDVRRRLKHCTVWSFSPAQIRLLQKTLHHLPNWGFSALRRHFGSLVNTLGTVEGYPIVAFLKIAYALDPSVKTLTAGGASSQRWRGHSLVRALAAVHGGRCEALPPGDERLPGYQRVRPLAGRDFAFVACAVGHDPDLV